MQSARYLPIALAAMALSSSAFAQGTDECSGATPIMGAGTFPMDTTSATTSPGSPCASIGRDVWFAWTAPQTDAFEFSTCGGAGWDTALAIYSGTCASPTLESCNDDSCGLQSEVRITATAGQTYFLRAGSFNGNGGGVGTITVTQGVTGGCLDPTSGADVIVGDIPGVSTYGDLGGMSAYSLGTTSCNVGDAELLWIAGNNQHPVIGQNIYRMENGRFEQVGQSWLKHGFTALQQNLCCDCNSSGTGTRLGVGCSDPYGSGLNGSQSGLGPRSQVNAFTGAFSYPFTAQGQTGDRVYKRLQVPTDDVDPTLHPDAVYFGEAQYVSPDDSGAGNGFNNVSYCPLNRNGNMVNGAFRLVTGGGQTVREQCAIRGWEAADSGVVAQDIFVPGEGMFIAGSNAIDNGDGTWSYEYAVFNNNSDFSGQSFTVPFGAGGTITNVGMSFPVYHSGEPYTNQAWTSTVSSNSVSWNTEMHMMNANANALRWGTTYSFWFTANAAPATVSASLGLFKPGNPGPQSVSLLGPGGDVGISNYCMANPNSTGAAGSIVASNVDLLGRTMQLEALNLPAQEFGFFVTSTVQAFVPNPGGSAGNLCLGGVIARGEAGGTLNTGAAGSFSGTVDLDMVRTPTGNTPVFAGETRYFQAWHRDTVAGTQTSNFTDAVEVLFP